MSHEDQAPSKFTGETKPSLSVLAVEDHLLLRESLVDLLSCVESIGTIKAVASAEEALEQIDAQVDLAIVDLSLPGKDGIWLTRQAKERYPELRILVLSMHETSDVLCRALEAGVDGYLTKCASRDELLKAIESIFVYGCYLQSRIAPTVIDALRHRQARKQSELNRRELHIGKCLVKGRNNNQIAQELSLSLSTVKTDIRSLYSKLKVSCRQEAIAKLARRELNPTIDRVANII